MGARGPVPKRSDARRRRNKPDQPVKKVAAAKEACPDCGEPFTVGAGIANHRRSAHGAVASRPAEADDCVGREPANPKWHSVARQWYDSLAVSAQRVFYQPSDWSTAYLIAHSISLELAPRPIFDESGKEVARVTLPPKGASLTAWLKGMSSLLVTEGDRRRLGIELEQAASAGSEPAAPVTSIASWKAGIGS
jgi:hypothetical protein